MASPQSSADYEATSAPKKHEQITFRFCSECSNMLYPKEDVDSHKLQFTCRTCQFTEEAQSTCVFRNDLNTSAGETAGVTQDVGSDPTVSDLPPCLCDFCGHIIYCTTCFEPASTMVMVKSSRENEQSTSMCHGTFPWADEDPFDEYDEELMSDLTRHDSSDQHSDCAFSETSSNGALEVSL